MHDTMKKPRHKTPSAAKRARSASGADEGDRQEHPSDRGRWSSRREIEVVLRIFRGETLDALSRELGVTPGKLAELRDEALRDFAKRHTATESLGGSDTERPVTCPPKPDLSATRVPTGPGWAERGFETLDETDTTHT